jgi:translation initiation factor IF-2
MNKSDLPGAAPEKVKGQLVEVGFTPEEYGGQVPLIPVSAKTGQGIDELLESIILHADILELENKPEEHLEAYRIESKIDKARGPVASAVLRQGTLSLGDYFYIGSEKTKVKALLDFQGKNIKSAYPSDPIEILGLTFAPDAGSRLSPEAYEIKAAAPSPRPSMLDPDSPKLPIVAKADTQGTLQALLGSLSDDVVVVHSGIGPISDNDIFLAESSKAQIIAFNVPTPSSVAKLADNQKVNILSSRIIYELLENLEAQVLKLLEPTIDENILGEATIMAEFKIEKVRIAGCRVSKGVLSKGDTIHLLRDGKIIKDSKIDSIRQGKNDVESIKSGNECGLTFKPYIDFKLNDAIISYNKTK